MKNLSFVLLLQFASFQLWSQLMVAPIAGANITKVHFSEEAFKSNPALRLHFGFQASYRISEKVSVGLCLQNSSKGYLGRADKPFKLKDARFQYVEMVPFAEYHLDKHWGFMAGSGLGVLSSESFRNDDKWVALAKEVAKSIDVSLLLGAKYYLGNAFLSISYNQSVISAFNYEIPYHDGGGFRKVKAYNQVLSLGLGYNFQLIHK